MSSLRYFSWCQQCHVRTVASTIYKERGRGRRTRTEAVLKKEVGLFFPLDFSCLHFAVGCFTLKNKRIHREEKETSKIQTSDFQASCSFSCQCHLLALYPCFLCRFSLPSPATLSSPSILQIIKVCPELIPSHLLCIAVTLTGWVWWIALLVQSVSYSLLLFKIKGVLSLLVVLFVCFTIISIISIIFYLTIKCYCKALCLSMDYQRGQISESFSLREWLQSSSEDL